MRYLYIILFYLALPFVFLRLLWRSRRAPLYRQRWAERLGYCPFKLNDCILVHAVSLGETIAAIPLIKALQAKYPHSPLLITNMTPTGSARVKAVFGDSVYNAYMPYDLPHLISRFFARVKPLKVVVMETELWPNFFIACQKRGIPLIVTNARLSAKSAKGYQRIAPLTREVLNAITLIAAQSQADADRFIALGMPSARVKVTGSLKFDLELPADLEKKSEALRQQLGDRLIWVAASTHLGEDEIMLTAQQIITKKIPSALLILIPRHLERFDSVETLIQQYGFNVVRRSKQGNCDASISVYLGDTMGEMMVMYSACDVACVAGSFVPIGGHNVIEPAALRKPIITGPHLFNFAEISDLMLKAEGMKKVENAEQLAARVIEFFENEKLRKQTGENAYSVVEKNRGALQRQVELV